MIIEIAGLLVQSLLAICSIITLFYLFKQLSVISKQLVAMKDQSSIMKDQLLTMKEQTQCLLDEFNISKEPRFDISLVQ